MTKNKGRILIVDDNEELLIALKMILTSHFTAVITEKDPNRIPSLLEGSSFDIILLDMNFQAGVNTGNEGIFWMNRIFEIDPAVTIVFITAFGDVELAVKAMKEGAADFIQKSWDHEKILSTILSAYKLRLSKLEISLLKSKQKHLKERIDSDFHFCIGISQAMKDVLRIVDKVSKTDATVLILGESGTGKEVIAREIHKRSFRAEEIFVNVDLGSLSETLFESELFGHVKGAFTDAVEDKPGRFEIASGGTLFLDEIGNLSLPLQSKLLTVIQNKEVVPIGSNSPVPVNIRLVSATNKPLVEMAGEGDFREDLLYRINTVQIEVPPLRDRPEDIPDLADFFLGLFQQEYHKESIRIGKPAMKALQDYSWPGNIRELKHVIEKAVIFCETNTISKDDLYFLEYRKDSGKPESFSLEENEKYLISEALHKFKGNISSTARALEINRSTLYEKIRKYGI
jgi:DNA-binding NtrC family response regulator